MTTKKKAREPMRCERFNPSDVLARAKGGPYLTRDMERVVRVALKGAHLDGRELELAKFKRSMGRIRKALAG